MAKVRTFYGARSNIVRPLGLVPKDEAQEPNETEESASVQLDSLAVAGVPAEVVEAVTAEINETVDEALEEGKTEEVTVDLDVELDLDQMEKPELQELAESLGVDPEGRIDHLRSRIRKAMKEE